MMTRKHFIRYMLAAACAALPAGHAAATDNYIGLYTFTPLLTVDRNGIPSDLVVSGYDYPYGGSLLGYSFEAMDDYIVGFYKTYGDIQSIYGDTGNVCYSPNIVFPPPPYIGLTATTMSIVFGCSYNLFQPGLPTYAFKAEGKPVMRMRTSDGSGFDALPLVVTRDGKPWQTYYFGYKMGLAAKTFDYLVETTDPLPSYLLDSLRAADFTLAKLPPPTVEGTVIEYVNTGDFPNSPGGHYFYSADPGEQALIDSGGAGAFLRTGRSFNAGGYASVCRFYGSMSPGPNSHFFTIDQGECDLLKSLQQTPAPSAAQQWNYEGQGFSGNTTIPDAAGGAPTCPAGSIPVYRAYNNAWDANGKNPWDSNHRISTDPDDIQEVVTKYGWQNEGIAMCAPQ